MGCSGSELLYTLKGHTKDVHSVAFSPNGKTLISGSWDGTIKLWDVPSKKLIATLFLNGDIKLSPIYSVAFSPAGNTVASASADGAVRLWNLSFC